MIGIAAAILLLGTGRVMGASGIVGGLVDGSGRPHRAEMVAFVGALAGVPALIAAVTGGAETHLTDNLATVILGGLLVGCGTRIAQGCTSGHGVCGISRLSGRGIAATLAYMLAAMATVTVARHVLGWI
jgi:uncharacterized membrane protein YedE/YeeE